MSKSQKTSQIKDKFEKISETFGTNQQGARLTSNKLKPVVEENVESEKTP